MKVRLFVVILGAVVGVTGILVALNSHAPQVTSPVVAMFLGILLSVLGWILFGVFLKEIVRGSYK